MIYKMLSPKDALTEGVNVLAVFQADNLQLEIVEIKGRCFVFTYQDGEQIGSPSLDWLLEAHMKRWAPRNAGHGNRSEEES